MSNKTEEQPLVTLARDEFTVERRRLDGHPEAVQASSRIDVTDDYGNTTTWVVDLYRLDGAVTAFVQRGAPDGYIRLVVPALVTAAISRHQSGLVTKQRRKTAQRVVADKRARGEQVGNPAALAAARARKSRRRK